jgi:hypothetical protein
LSGNEVFIGTQSSLLDDPASCISWFSEPEKLILSGEIDIVLRSPVIETNASREDDELVPSRGDSMVGSNPGGVIGESRPEVAVGMGIGNEGPLPLPNMPLGSGSCCPLASMGRFRCMASGLDRASAALAAIDVGN